MSPTLRCPLCAVRFDHVVALEFHVRGEHPGAVEAARPLFRDLRRSERQESSASAKSSRIPALLERVYRRGYPCGRSYTAHLQARRGLT